VGGRVVRVIPPREERVERRMEGMRGEKGKVWV